MMFRKLYWVTEALDANGNSHVEGVYTSIPDLIRHGLRNLDQHYGLRLTLSKLDSQCGPLGSWESPSFEGLDVCLQEFVATEEFSQDHCKALLDALRQPVPA